MTSHPEAKEVLACRVCGTKNAAEMTLTDPTICFVCKRLGKTVHQWVKASNNTEGIDEDAGRFGC